MWTLISGLIPAKADIYLFGGLALLIGTLAFIHHERAIQQAKDTAADAKAVLVQQQHKAKVEADAQLALTPADNLLHLALTGSGTDSPIVVRVCPAPHTGSSGQQRLSPDGGTVAGSGSPTGSVPGSVAGVPQIAGVNIGPTTEQLLGRADAEIAYWRNYYTICHQQGICK